MPYIHNKLRLAFPTEAESVLWKIYRYKYELMFHMALGTFHCYRKVGNFISPSQFPFHLDSSYGCLPAMTVSQNLGPIFISSYLDTKFGILHLDTNIKLFFSILLRILELSYYLRRQATENETLRNSVKMAMTNLVKTYIRFIWITCARH